MMQVPMTNVGMETLERLIADAKDIRQITVYDYIPESMKEHLIQVAQERGFSILIVEPSVRIDIRTQADLDAEEDTPKWVGRK